MTPPGQRLVGRDVELARLNGYTTAAIAGRGQVAFVSGEAGAGKTTLLQGFAAALAEHHPDILVAGGRCSTMGAVGDPYLPWREVMSSLLGVAGGAPAHADSPAGERWRRRLASSVDLLLDVGPDLLGAIVPGAGLLAALAVAVAPKDKLLAELRRQEKASPALSLAAVEPARIVEQYSNVLLELSRSDPVVILLDDLHWVDQPSAGLLFHLSQRIATEQVLIVGNYRAAEVATAAPGASGARHPLSKVLNEVKRYGGDVTIDLDNKTETDRAQFFDQILDLEANRFSPPFRSELLQLTGGQALYTVEVLRTLIERGDITSDEDGHWVDRPGTDLAAVPARVEGVIEERVERISSEQRELLDVACVEGSSGGPGFTAEILCQVLDRPLRRVVTDLSGELDHRHRLVMEQASGDDVFGWTGYQFTHVIVQRYLYDELARSQRRLNHADIAAALQELAGDRAEEFSAALAWHHEQAGHPREAATWLTEAAERAASAGAPEQAAEMFRRALTLLPAGATGERWRAGLGLVSVLRTLQADAAVVAALHDVIGLAESIGDRGMTAEAYWRLGWFQLVIDDEAAHDAAVPALQAAREAGRADIEARVLADTSYIERRRAQPEVARRAAAQAWALAKHLDDETILYVAWRLSFYYADEGDLGRAMELAELAVAKARNGDRQVLIRVLTALTEQCLQLGHFDRAKALSEEALAVIQQIGTSNAVPIVLANLGIIALVEGDVAGAESHLRRALSHATGGGAFVSGGVELHLGMTLEADGRTDEAADIFRRAADRFAGAGQESQGVECWAGLARCALANGEMDTALRLADRVWAVLTGPERLQVTFLAPAMSAFLTCSDVFTAAGLADRAHEVLEFSMTWLNDRASSISDPAWRASVLNAVPEHRRLHAEYQRRISPRVSPST